jgi:translation elongation factor EF-Tu-like GTPase
MSLISIFIVGAYSNTKSKMKRYFIAVLTVLLIAIYLAGMIAYQKVFYYKKEVRRGILLDLKKLFKSFDGNRSYYFVDMPIREDEIRYMIYLWYDTKDLNISLIEGKPLRRIIEAKNSVVLEYRKNHLYRLK